MKYEGKEGEGGGGDKRAKDGGDIEMEGGGRDRGEDRGEREARSILRRTTSTWAPAGSDADRKPEIEEKRRSETKAIRRESSRAWWRAGRARKNRNGRADVAGKNAKFFSFLSAIPIDVSSLLRQSSRRL